MDKTDAQNAMEMIAMQNGISLQALRRELEDAIDIGMKYSDLTTNSFWAACMKNGRKPTPEEFIIYMAEMVMADMER